MASYMEIVNDANTVLVDDDYIHVGIRRRANASIPAGGQEVSGSFSGGSDYACAAFISATPMSVECGSSSWHAERPYGSAGSATGNILIFDKPVDTYTPGVPIFQCWDEAGNIVFDSGNDMARVVTTITSYGAHTLPSGRTYALMFLKNSFHREVTWYHQGNNLYHYDIYRYRTYAKVVGNVVTVSKEQSGAPWIYREEPVGQVGIGGGFNDASFAILVLDVTGYDTTGSTVGGHTVSAADIASSNNVANTYVYFNTSAVVSGGVGPFTYQWSWVGDHHFLDINGSATGSTVQVRAIGAGNTRTGTLRVAVTDTGSGNVVATDDVSVSVGFAAAAEVTITNKTITESGTAVGLRVHSSGKLYKFTSLSGPFTEIGPSNEWRDPESSSPDYQVRAAPGYSSSLKSRNGMGSPEFPNYWIRLGSGAGNAAFRDFWVESGKSDSFTIEFRKDSDLSLVASATVSLTAQVSTHSVSVPNASPTGGQGWIYKGMTASVSGGVGPFTYAWSFVGTHTGVQFDGATNQQSVTVASNGNYGDVRTATIRCTVTDTGNGNVQVYDDGNMTFTHQNTVKLTDKNYSEVASILGFRLKGGGTISMFTNTSGPFPNVDPSDEWLYPMITTPPYAPFVARAVNISGTLYSRTWDGSNYASIGASTWNTIGGVSRDWWNPLQGTTVSFKVQIAHEDNLSNIVAEATITLTTETASVHTVSATNIFSPSNPNGTVQKTSTATVSGGVGPFTYNWSWVGGTPAGLQIASGGSSQTVYVASTGFNTVRSGTLRCTVTDTGSGNVTAYDDISINITHGTPP